jgi:hypothetical protein
MHEKSSHTSQQITGQVYSLFYLFPLAFINRSDISHNYADLVDLFYALVTWAADCTTASRHAARCALALRP